MPRGDKTGPMGQGSRSGRGKGFCSGSNQPGYMDVSPGGSRGLGRRAGRGMGKGEGRGQEGGGRGLGRGWRHNAPDYNECSEEAVDNQQDKESLAKKAKQLEAELAEIKNKMAELE